MKAALYSTTAATMASRYVATTTWIARPARAAPVHARGVVARRGGVGGADAVRVGKRNMKRVDGETMQPRWSRRGMWFRATSYVGRARHDLSEAHRLRGAVIRCVVACPGWAPAAPNRTTETIEVQAA